MPTSTYSEPEQSNENLEKLVDQILIRLRISPALSGFRSLAYVITQVSVGCITTDLITKDLYPKAAKRFETRSSRIERSIRTAVEYSWTHGGRDELDQMVGYHLVKQKPLLLLFRL